MNSVVHLHNTSGSQLEVTVFGLMMEKDAISWEAFPLEKVEASAEINKWRHHKFLQILTPEEVVARRSAKEESIADVDGDVPTVPLLPSLEEASPTRRVPLTVPEMFDEAATATLEEAVQQLQSGLAALQAVLTNQKSPPPPPLRKPTPEARISTEGASAVNTSSSAETDDDEVIFNSPPPGLKPMNDPAKRFLGYHPFDAPLPYTEKILFLNKCNDPGILREIAMFEAPGKIKEAAKRKLREAKALAHV